MSFEQYCKQLEAAARQSVITLLTQRADALRSCIADGVVQEATAIKTLHAYAIELGGVAEEWYELDALMLYIQPSSSGSYKISKQKCHSPETAREKRGDFDSDRYPMAKDKPCRYEGEGMQMHNLHIDL